MVPVSFFGVVLGLIGLGSSWRAASRLWEVHWLPGELVMLAGALVWAVVLALYLAKWVFAPEEAVAEARHPIQSCYVGLAGVATMMVSMAVLPHSRLAAEALFLAGLGFTVGFAAWRTGGLWMGDRSPEAVTPVLYLPTVAGGFVAASAGAALSFDNLAGIAFGAGFFSWLGIESVLLHRLFTGSPVQPGLRPTLLLQLAPPTVGGVAAVNVLGDAWSVLPAAMFGYALLQALVLLRLLPWILGRSFAPAYWGSSFGATALALLAMRMIERGEASLAAALAPWLFAGANLVVAMLVLGSVSLLVRGRLIAPTPASAATVAN